MGKLSLILALSLAAAGAGLGCRPRAEPPGMAVASLRYRDGALIPANTLSSRAQLDSFAGAWCSRQLTALGEQRLATGSGLSAQETYRFLWLRTFHHPVAVRIYKAGPGAVVVTSETSGAGGYAPGSLSRRDSVGISEADWRTFVALIDREQVWNRAATDTLRSGLDGAEWIVEGQRGDRYTITERWSPSEADSSAFMWRLGLAMLHVGRVNVSSSELY